MIISEWYKPINQKCIVLSIVGRYNITTKNGRVIPQNIYSNAVIYKDEIDSPELRKIKKDMAVKSLEHFLFIGKRLGLKNNRGYFKIIKLEEIY